VFWLVFCVFGFLVWLLSLGFWRRFVLRFVGGLFGGLGYGLGYPFMGLAG